MTPSDLKASPQRAGPEPAAVGEAREVLARHARSTLVMMGGVFSVVLGLLLAGPLLQSEAGVNAAIATLLVWVFGNVARLGMAREQVRVARSVVEEWEGLAIRAELGLEAPPRATPSTAEAEPADARWAAVRRLVDRIEALAGDDEASALAREARERLRGLIADVEMLAESLGLEQDLQVGDDPRVARLRAAHARSEAEIGHLVEALRDVHVELASRRVPGAADQIAALRGLRAMLEARAEVEAVAEPAAEGELRRRDAARRARAAQRE